MRLKQQSSEEEKLCKHEMQLKKGYKLMPKDFTE